MKILLIDALKHVDKSERNTAWVSYDEMCNALNIAGYFTSDEFSDEWERRVKSYWLFKWLCTDTHVGCCAYFFDDELVGVSYQGARKNPVEYSFVSKAAADKLRSFILDSQESQYVLIDPEEHVEDFYTVDYGSQLLVEEGFHEGVKVTVSESWRGDYRLPVEEWQTITIKLPNGQQKRIHLNEFHIPINMEPEQSQTESERHAF